MDPCNTSDKLPQQTYIKLKHINGISRCFTDLGLLTTVATISIIVVVTRVIIAAISSVSLITVSIVSIAVIPVVAVTLVPTVIGTCSQT